MRKPLYLFFLSLFILNSCSTAPLSKEDTFIEATAQIACATRNMGASDSADSSQENAQPTGKDIQDKADTIARQYGFKGVEDLNILAKAYKTNQTIVNKTKEKIKQMCP